MLSYDLKYMFYMHLLLKLNAYFPEMSLMLGIRCSSIMLYNGRVYFTLVNIFLYEYLMEIDYCHSHNVIDLYLHFCFYKQRK